jgi:hypothetical protein
MVPYGREILFYSFIAIFVATAVITLLGIAGRIKIQPRFLNRLFVALVLELVAAVIGLFVATDFFGEPDAPIPDFSGKWDYVCTATTKEYEHGGIVNTIQATRTQYGIAIEIEAERQWVDEPPEGRKTVAFNWHSTSGMMTSKTKLKFEYLVERGDATIVGYCWADIEYKDGKPNVIKGNFYQHAPTDALAGTFTFRKQ